MTIRLRLLFGFLILILVFALVLAINRRLTEQVQINTDYLSSSEIVIRNSNILHKEMIEMQSGFRGFLLTDQETFLSPYYDGLKNVPGLMNELRGQISDQKQKQKLDLINGLHKDWVEYADSLISTKKDTLPEAGRRYKRLFNKKLKMEVGKKLNDTIHVIFGDFDNGEYALRQERRTALQDSIRSTRVVSLTLTIGFVVISLLASFYFIRVITKRISTMVSFAERISKGDFINIRDGRKDELAKLVDSLNQMSATLGTNFSDLKKKNQELDQFAYVVSHDLKAPLRGISNIISWIEEDHGKNIDPDIQKNLNLIKGRADRLERMINGLLQYARVEKTRKGVERIDVDQMLREIKELIVPNHVHMITNETMPVIYAERLHLEQVFTNLIDNAIKYNNSTHPKITVGYHDMGDHYGFSVRDNGPGIEEQYFEKIFVIFQTLQERDAFESTGVGLAIVKKIIEDHGGVIRVESELGKGTTFRFTWPKQEKNGEEKKNTTNRG